MLSPDGPSDPTLLLPKPRSAHLSTPRLLQFETAMASWWTKQRGLLLLLALALLAVLLWGPAPAAAASDFEDDEDEVEDVEFDLSTKAYEVRAWLRVRSFIDRSNVRGGQQGGREHTIVVPSTHRTNPRLLQPIRRPWRRRTCGWWTISRRSAPPACRSRASWSSSPRTPTVSGEPTHASLHRLLPVENSVLISCMQTTLSQRLA